MSEPFLGQMIQFGGNFAIRSWALCNGQLMSIAQNSALFALLGTTYGGDGQVTFGLPNCQSRVSMHWGQGPGQPDYGIGQMSGSPTVTLLSTNLPSAPVNVLSTSNQATAASPVSNLPAAPVNPSDGSALNGYSGAGTVNGTLSGVFLQGGNQPVEVTPPYLCVTWLIALEGIFPPRN